MKENSIEKDEEILNNIKAYMQENIDKGCHKFVYNDLGYDEKCVDVINAIEHILSDYKRVLKENEHKTEKIENQKSELAILNDKQKDFNKLQNTLKSYKGQFRRQEKENEKLKNQEATAREINELLVQRYSNSISVQKVKDKIEELTKEGRHYNANKIEVLQELLEKR